jgi:transcriptional regulator with XRE-family HTH domain
MNDGPAITVAEFVANARIAMGLSRPYFASEFGVSVSTVQRWENGMKAPRKDALMSIVARSGLPLPALLRTPTSAAHPDVSEFFGESRIALGINQKALGLALGISTSAVAEMEAGKYLPQEAVLLRLSQMSGRALPLSLTQLAPFPHDPKVAAAMATVRDFETSFHAFVRSARQATGKNRREFGALIGVTEVTIGNWETRRTTPLARNVYAVARQAGQELPGTRRLVDPDFNLDALVSAMPGFLSATRDILRCSRAKLGELLGLSAVSGTTAQHEWGVHKMKYGAMLGASLLSGVSLPGTIPTAGA